MKPIFLALLIFFLMPSCVEELDLGFPTAAEFIVVDGILNYHSAADSNDLVVYLNVSNTLYSRPAPLGGAQMELIVNESAAYPFTERERGTYYFYDSQVFAPGNRYQLRFQIGEDYYESSPEILPDTVALGQVYAALNQGGTADDAYEIFVDMEDDPSQKNYYRWLITQWERQDYCQFCYREGRNPERCESDLFALPEVQLTRNNFCETGCYDILRFTPNNSISDVYIDGKSLIRKSVGFVPFNFNRPCLVEVMQSSLTPGYFSFLEVLRSQAESTGGLADTPAALLTGNVQNKTHPEQKVVGYFSVANNTVKRYWLKRDEGLAAGFYPLGNLNPPISPPIPTPPSWQPVPCVPGKNRTPVKPWGWID